MCYTSPAYITTTFSITTNGSGNGNATVYVPVPVGGVLRPRQATGATGAATVRCAFINSPGVNGNVFSVTLPDALPEQEGGSGASTALARTNTGTGYAWFEPGTNGHPIAPAGQQRVTVAVAGGPASTTVTGTITLEYLPGSGQLEKTVVP